MNEQFWNERYAQEEYVYGKAPNVFFKSVIDQLKPGRLLVPGAGEGRDAVYAATLGWQVDAFDSSETGRIKALSLAQEKGVNINYRLMDAADNRPPVNGYDLIVLSYLHLPPALRAAFHQALAQSLAANGRIVTEAFHVDQLQYNSGGPRNKEWLFTNEMLASDWPSLTILENSHQVIQLDEGSFHKGAASIVRCIAVNSQLQP